MYCVVKVYTPSLRRDRKWYVFFAWITRRFSRRRALSDGSGPGRGDDGRHLVVDAELLDSPVHMKVDRAFTQIEDPGNFIGRLAIGRQFQYFDFPP
ncbi:hypothetical protein D9M73_233510 [compost metagenome]